MWQSAFALRHYFSVDIRNFGALVSLIIPDGLTTMSA
jgi:hypothetical protein